MRTHNIRAIILKNPSLRLLRSNLRTILKLAVNERLLEKTDSGLYRIFRSSTLGCGLGAACATYQRLKDPKDRPTDIDLIWVPWIESWVCQDCFKKGRYDDDTSDDFDDPEYREWVRETFNR